MKNRISLSAREKIGLISSFSTMLNAGISLVEAIDSLASDAKGAQKKFLETLKTDTMQGNPIHTSFDKFPLIFDKVTVNIIKAAERSGTLDVTLKDLKENIKRDMEFTNKVKSALMYPALIGVVFIAVLTLILFFVIPKISAVFSQLRVELPLPTQIMIFVSNFVLKNTVFVVLGLIMIAAVLTTLYRTNKKLLLQIFFSLPLISDLARKVDLTRFTRSLYLLLTAGIPIVAALELAQDVVMKKEITRAISYSREVVYAGGKLSDGFENSKDIFPSIMIKITEAGEKSGTLDRSMQDVADYLEDEVSNNLRTLITLLEPLMLVVIGVFIGGMMLSIMAPIYGLIGKVGVHR